MKLLKGSRFVLIVFWGCVATCSFAEDDPCKALYEVVPSAPLPKPKPLTEEEIKKLVSERACIKSFPWPEAEEKLIHTTGLKDITTARMEAIRNGVFTFIDKYTTSPPDWYNELTSLPQIEQNAVFAIEADSTFGTKLKARGYIAKVNKFQKIIDSYSAIPKEERDVAFFIQDGGDVEQLRLFADSLYARFLLKDGRLNEAIDCVKAARKRSGLNINEYTLDEMDETTTFSKQCLINILGLVEFSARARSAPQSIGEKIRLISDYADAKHALDPVTAFGGDPISDLENAIDSKDFSSLTANLPSWKQSEALKSYPDLQGFFEDEDGTVLFVGEKNPKAIVFNADGEISLLDKAESQQRFEKFCQRKLNEHSTFQMQLFDFIGTPEGGIMQVANGSEIRFSKDEYALISGGKPLPPDHELTKYINTETTKVMFAHPLMMKEGLTSRETARFTFDLQRAYPSAKIMCDPLSQQTANHAAEIANFTVDKPSDLLVIVPGTDNPIPQGKTILNIVPELRDASVNVTVFNGNEKASKTGGKAVFVITGHSSEELARFVRQVGDAGFFRDNYVVFNTCETEMTRQLVSEVNDRYGAVGSYSFQGKIQASDVQDYLLDFTKKLSKKKKINFVQQLLESALKYNLVGTFTICKAF